MFPVVIGCFRQCSDISGNVRCDRPLRRGWIFPVEFWTDGRNKLNIWGIFRFYFSMYYDDVFLQLLLSEQTSRSSEEKEREENVLLTISEPITPRGFRYSYHAVSKTLNVNCFGCGLLYMGLVVVRWCNFSRSRLLNVMWSFVCIMHKWKITFCLLYNTTDWHVCEFLQRARVDNSCVFCVCERSEC